MWVNRIGKCVEFPIKSNFKSMIISQSVSIVRIVLKGKLRSKMAPKNTRRSARNKVNQSAPKSNAKKKKTSEEEVLESGSESDGTTGIGDPELDKIMESALSEVQLMKEAVTPAKETPAQENDKTSTDKLNPVEGTSALQNASRKRKSSPGKKPEKKKNLEFEDKRNVAIAVSKHANLYDVANPKYSDKRAENAAWRDVSESANLPIEDCIKHWISLKRSANYYVRPKKILFKSGAGADELDNDDTKKYKDDWQYADAMSFFTPPALKQHEKLISVCNTMPSDEMTEVIEVYEHGTSSMDSFEVVDNIYVSKLGTNNLMIFLNENERSNFYVQYLIVVVFFSNFQDGVLKKPKSTNKEDIAGSFATMANTFSNYLVNKGATTSEHTQPLKYQTMWAHFDKMINKLDDDAIEDLNFDIMKLIGDAIKKQRQKSSILTLPLTFNK